MNVVGDTSGGLPFLVEDNSGMHVYSSGKKYAKYS